MMRVQNDPCIGFAEHEKWGAKLQQTTRRLCMAALAVVGALLTGCSSADEAIADNPQQPVTDHQVVTLTTSVSLDGSNSATRALTDQGVKTFAAGDQLAVVYVNTSNETVKATSVALTAGDITDEGAAASFTVTLTDPKASAKVRYIYPASMVADDVSSTTPDATATINYNVLAAQDGTLDGLASSLDLGIYDGTLTDQATLPTGTCVLTNQLAVAKLTIKNGGNDITGTITGLTIYDGTNTYTVTRSAAAGPIYVALNPIAAGDLLFTANDDTSNYRKSVTGKTLVAGHMYPIGISTLPAGMLTGIFTIDANGTATRFAEGNLQATYDGTSSWTWAFAPTQWSCIGKAVGNTNVTTSSPYISGAGTVDLFGWVGLSSTWEGVAQYGINKSETVNATDGYGNVAGEGLKADWGTLPITNGGNTANSGWFTMSSAQWAYLCNTRASGSTVNGTSDARYTMGTINTDGTSVSGLILFPDGVTIADSEASWGTINAGSAYTTECTTAQWTALEAKGCVFLPAAGYRYSTTVSVVNSQGCYQSSSSYADNVNHSIYLYFLSNGNFWASYNAGRSSGRSVRLVKSNIRSISFASSAVTRKISDGAFINTLTNTGDGSVSYTSSNTSVATVDATTGEVTPLSAGTTTITANATNGTKYEYKTNTISYELTVRDDATITFANSEVVKLDNDADFTITVTKTGDGSVSYTSSDTSVAIVDASTGTVTIVSAGTATITATAASGTYYDYPTNTVSYTLTVKATSYSGGTNATAGNVTKEDF